MDEETELTDAKLHASNQTELGSEPTSPDFKDLHSQPGTGFCSRSEAR